MACRCWWLLLVPLQRLQRWAKGCWTMSTLFPISLVDCSRKVALKAKSVVYLLVGTTPSGSARGHLAGILAQGC